MTPMKGNGRQGRLTVRDVLLFMPEGLGAAVVMVYAPIYGAALIRRGLVFPALSLAVGFCVIAFLAYRGFRRHSKTLVYLAILAALGLWFAINYWAGIP